MGATWRFRIMRQDGTSSFIRKAAGKVFVGSIDQALAFAQRIQRHFDQIARRVEAWSLQQVEPQEQSGRQLVCIQRHENPRGWRCQIEAHARGMVPQADARR